MIWWITWMFAAYGKVFLVRKIRGPDRGHLYAMKVSASTIKRWELEWKSWTPLCYNNDNASNQSNFAAGVEEGKHCAEEENNRAHKDGATGISSTHQNSFLKNIFGVVADHDSRSFNMSLKVLETIRQSPFLVTMHYAFQTPAKLHLVLGEWNHYNMSMMMWRMRIRMMTWMRFFLTRWLFRLCEWRGAVHPPLPKREVQGERSEDLHGRDHPRSPTPA